MRRAALLFLALAACSHRPSTWTLVGREIPGWQVALAETRKEATCDPTPWGGEIIVRDVPWDCLGNGRLCAGYCGSDSRIEVLWFGAAEFTALAHEGCHTLLSICSKNYWEQPAIDCAARVNARLRAAGSGTTAP